MWIVPLEDTLSPSPIRWVLGGRTHVEGMEMGAEGVVADVAGSRMVDGGGLVMPYHGLGWLDGHVMLVPAAGKPRASMTAPLEVRYPFDTVKIVFNTEQMSVVPRPRTLASTKARDFAQQFWLELYTALVPVV